MSTRDEWKKDSKDFIHDSLRPAENNPRNGYKRKQLLTDISSKLDRLVGRYEQEMPAGTLLNIAPFTEQFIKDNNWLQKLTNQLWYKTIGEQRYSELTKVAKQITQLKNRRRPADSTEVTQAIDEVIKALEGTAEQAVSNNTADISKGVSAKLHKLPKLLVIDDEYARDNEKRANFCDNCRVIDITPRQQTAISSDANIEKSSTAQAQAHFIDIQITPSNKDSYETEIINSIKQALNATQHFALILLDLVFTNRQSQHVEIVNDERFGLAILRCLAESELAWLPVVIVSNEKCDDTLQRKFTTGVHHFIQKNDLGDEMLDWLLNKFGLIEDDEIIGASVPLLETLREVRQLASLRGNLLILGESGTGKELLAKYAHKFGHGYAKIKSEKPNPFIKMLATGNDNMVEEQLFGHKKGAFTGATADKKGAALLADGGTYFPRVRFGVFPIFRSSYFFSIARPKFTLWNIEVT